MLANNSSSPPSIHEAETFSCLENGHNNINNKRKRRPAGTPDPDAEVVSLSPKTLLESDRYVCEICNQGFQRDQNLQMHRRRHKVPWKLLKRETPVVRKRVFVCPEPSCLHHDPCHALGDLVGIKKHFRRKHSNNKQWVCEKCSKGYAVQSDYKAHLKTCGTRGHSCDCGRVFSRVESFIEHQDSCNMGRLRLDQSPALQPAACLSRTASSPSPSSETNFSPTGTAAPNWPSNLILAKPTTDTLFSNNPTIDNSPKNAHYHNNNNNTLELQLLTTDRHNSPNKENHSTQLQLSIGSSSDLSYKNISTDQSSKKPTFLAARMKEEAREQLKLAMVEKSYAEEARNQAKRQIELAEQEFANAKKIRQQAQAELDKAHALKEHAVKQINSAILEVTCRSCKQQFQTIRLVTPPDENSLVQSYNNNNNNNVSSALTEGEGEVEKVNRN
ncbi:hypothetical protein ACFE04_009203 [Oxalis oulophora]